MALLGSLNEPLFAPCLLVGVECRFYLDLLGFWAVFGLSGAPEKHHESIRTREVIQGGQRPPCRGRNCRRMDYSLLRSGIEFTLGEDVPDGTWVCIFKAIQNGFPYAHDFGTWSEAEGRLVNRRPHVWEKRI